jgi:hypothetical protein
MASIEEVGGKPAKVASDGLITELGLLHVRICSMKSV